MAEKYQIKLTDEAEENFDGILHYLLTNYSHDAATNALIAIKEKVLSLSRFPEAHPIYHTSESRKITYRYIIAKKVHRIIFTVKVERLLVIVSRITHVKMLKRQITDRLEEE